MRAQPVTRRARPALALALATTVLVLMGCATGAGSPAPLGDNGPHRPAAGGAELVVDGQHLDAPVVLDPTPAGLRLTSLRHNPPDDGHPPSRATLYGDPSLADTLDGPVLLVGSSSGSAIIGGPPLSAPGERRVDLGDREGWLVHVEDRTWVGIEQTESQDYVQFVVARGVSDEELIRAAETADFSTDTAAVAPGAVPEGLEPLIAGETTDGPYVYGAGESIRLLGDPYINVYVHAVRAEPRLAALWGFWADDAAGTLVRGQPGSVGDMNRQCHRG